MRRSCRGNSIGPRSHWISTSSPRSARQLSYVFLSYAAFCRQATFHQIKHTMDTSCYTCRRRRVACQMAQPPCRKCTQAGLQCTKTRPFRWVQGAAFRTTARRDTPAKKMPTHDVVAVGNHQKSRLAARGVMGMVLHVEVEQAFCIYEHCISNSYIQMPQIISFNIRP